MATIDAEMIWAGIGTADTIHEGVMVVQEKDGRRNVIIGTGVYALTVTAESARAMAAAITENVSRPSDDDLHKLWKKDGCRETFESYVRAQRMGSWGQRGELARSTVLPEEKGDGQ